MRHISQITQQVRTNATTSMPHLIREEDADWFPVFTMSPFLRPALPRPSAADDVLPWPMPLALGWPFGSGSGRRWTSTAPRPSPKQVPACPSGSITRWQPRSGGTPAQAVLDFGGAAGQCRPATAGGPREASRNQGECTRSLLGPQAGFPPQGPGGVQGDTETNVPKSKQQPDFGHDIRLRPPFWRNECPTAGIDPEYKIFRFRVRIGPHFRMYTGEGGAPARSRPPCRGGRLRP
jgi:hypothetical protein